jgi:hypothetical protein
LPTPKTRAQKPRFFFFGFSSSAMDVDSVAGSTATGAESVAVGIPVDSAGTGCVSRPNSPATRSKNEVPGCSGQVSVGCVPRTKYSVYTVDLMVRLPSSSMVSAVRQPSVASLPLMRQIVALPMPDGGLNQAGSSLRVATVMSRPHNGTARSAA